jgi:cyclopropane-fatty-acyl-phospholipid synthase
MARGTTQAAIEHHYDAGNYFFELWLDSSLTYSCPLWEDGDGDDALHEAQLRKLDYHALAVRAAGKSRVLDIGCGWGSMATRLVATHNVKKVVGLTMSRAQAQYALEANRHDKSIEIQVAPWQAHVPERPYDAIVSIEAFEHFGRKDESRDARVAAYRDFFAYCRKNLTPGGRLSIQVSAFERQTEAPDFITTTIWPESQLPRISEILEASDHLFEVVSVANDRTHYARTCALWSRRLIANRSRAVDIVGEKVVQNYIQYLRMSAAAFWKANYSLYRILFQRLN